MGVQHACMGKTHAVTQFPSDAMDDLLAVRGFIQELRRNYAYAFSKTLGAAANKIKSTARATCEQDGFTCLPCH